MIYNVLVVGIGGQGVLLVAKAIAAAAAGAYLFACRTESRGLSQRGGSVSSTVRFGDGPVSPEIRAGGADLILSLDALEGLRALSWLRPDGWLLTNREGIPPAHLSGPWQGMKEEGEVEQSVLQVFRSHSHVRVLELKALATRAACARGLN